MLSVAIKEVEPVSIVILEGRFDASGAVTFEENLKELNCLFPVLDFTKVTYLSSAGIRILIQTEKLLRTQNGKLIFTCVSSTLKQVLSITGLLDQFTIAKNAEEALKLSSEMISASANKFNQFIRDRNYSIRELPGSGSTLEIWSETTSGTMTSGCLASFQFGLGTGGFGNTRVEALESAGNLFISKKFLGITPEKKQDTSDFLFSQNPEDTFFFLSSAINISGAPSALIEMKDDSPVPIKEIISDAISVMSDISLSSAAAGFILLGSPAGYKSSEVLLSIVFCLDKFGGVTNESLKRAFEKIKPQNIDDKLYYASQAVILHVENQSAPGEDIEENINSVLKSENIKEIIIPSADMQLSAFRLWIFTPAEINSAEKLQLKIDVENNFILKDEYEIIVHKIYSDCSRIILKQLHGGFSATTFQVQGYDKKGIRILPTVLKLGKQATIYREVFNFSEHVQKYILNNSTSVMGSYYCGDYGGVRYNFVGITGPESQIRWLTHDYIKKSAEDLKPLFDRIFTHILVPWYGQPRLETFYPYKEHNPTRVFFPELFEKCEEELSISADTEKIFSNELEREIINPYWFLKHGYREREKNPKLWYKCICHGDLNMQNILLDELQNVYIIDYSETETRNAVADFARLEPIFKFEFTKLDSEEELKNLLEFESGLLTPDRLDELPEFRYKGNDPAVEKAYKLICRLRQYANTVTLFEYDIIPYLVAVLEWTFSVVCYQSVNHIRKRYSSLSAALICEKIIEIERRNKN